MRAPEHWRPASRQGETCCIGSSLLPAARDFYVHWDVVTDIMVSEFREVAGSDLGDPRLRATIDGLSAHSPRFRELWSRADVGYQPGPMDLHHPQAATLIYIGPGSACRTRTASIW